MRRGILALLLIIATGIGCNAIVGNDSHSLDACTPDTTKCDDDDKTILICEDGKSFTKKETCPSACTDGACTGSCDEGMTRCKGKIPETCNAMGAWEDQDACPGLCVDGKCKAECKLNDTRCMGDAVQVCDETGVWMTSTTCPFVCKSGVCTGMCVPDSTQCNGNTPQKCDDDGKWQSGDPCPKVCSAGKCAGMCTPGSMQCSNLIPETCNSNGTFDDGTPCQFVCQGGTCTGVCTPNDKRCMGNTPQICDADGQWQAGADCPFVCSAGVCGGMCDPGSMHGCGSVATCNAGGMEACDMTGTLGSCMPAASTCAMTPSGWSPVAVTNGACPNGFGFPLAYISTVSAAPYTCSCQCGGTQTCSGSGVLNQYASATCAGSPAASTNVSFSTACGTGGPAIEGGDGYILSNVTFAPHPACSATPVATNKPTPTEGHVTVCTPNLACTGGACLDAAEQMNLCVSHSGMTACPAGFPTQTVVASAIADGRGCGSCACGTTLGCTFQSLLIDNDAACGTGNIYNFTEAAGTCVKAPNSYPFNASKANATVTGSGTCAQTAPSNPTGSAALDPTKLLTICCP
jgi:hypothetical protein